MFSDFLLSKSKLWFLINIVMFFYTNPASKKKLRRWWKHKTETDRKSWKQQGTLREQKVTKKSKAKVRYLRCKSFQVPSFFFLSPQTFSLCKLNLSPLFIYWFRLLFMWLMILLSFSNRKLCPFSVSSFSLLQLPLLFLYANFKVFLLFLPIFL